MFYASFWPKGAQVPMLRNKKGDIRRFWIFLSMLDDKSKRSLEKFFSRDGKKCVLLQPETATALSLAEQSARGTSGQQRVAILPNGKGHVPAKGVLQTVPQKIYRYIRGQKPLV